MNTQVSVKLVKDTNTRKLLEYLLNKIKGLANFSEAPIDGEQYVRQDGAWVIAEGGTLPYKVYTAYLSQTGTSAPTDVILENTTGGTVTYSYNGPGEYEGTCVGFTIPEDKFVPIPFIANMDDLVISMERLTDTTFRITTTQISDRVALDELVYGVQPLSFKIYN